MRVLAQAEIEDRILQVSDIMDELTHTYADQLAEQAEAESTYRVRYYKAILTLKAGTDRMTDKTAEARATVLVEGELRDYKRLSAQCEATKQALFTHRSRLDALRTLSSNARAQT